MGKIFSSYTIFSELHHPTIGYFSFFFYNFKVICVSFYYPKGIFLSEIRPSEDVSTKMEFDPMAEILSPNFTIEVDRFSTGDNLGFDRVLSKWVLLQDNGGDSKIISHARYADEIEASENIPVKKVTGKKGLGGFSVSRGFTSDLDY